MQTVNFRVAHRQSFSADLLSSRSLRETLDTASVKRGARRAQRRALQSEVPAALENARLELADLRQARAEKAAAEQAVAATNVELQSWQASLVGRLSLPAFDAQRVTQRVVTVTRKAPMRRTRSELLRVYA